MELNTTNCQNNQISSGIGPGLNPVQIRQVDSELHEVPYMTNHSDDTVPKNENMDCRGSVNSHSNSTVCEDIPDMSMGLEPTIHNNKVVSGSNLENQDKCSYCWG